MSLHEQLDDLVAEAKADYLKQLQTIKNLMGRFKGEWLPAYFGGSQKDYNFFHPTESGDGKETNEASILPEKGSKFALGLAINVGTNIVCFLRMSDVSNEKADIQIIGSEKVHHLPSETAIKAFCKQLFELAKNAVSKHGIQESTKTLAVNVYE